MGRYLRILLEDGNDLLQETGYFILLEIQPKTISKFIILVNTNKILKFRSDNNNFTFKSSPTKFTIMEV